MILLTTLFIFFKKFVFKGPSEQSSQIDIDMLMGFCSPVRLPLGGRLKFFTPGFDLRSYLPVHFDIQSNSNFD